MQSIVILGGGPAGLSAAIYAARAGFPVSVLYRDGGALEKAKRIENYFGFPTSLTGAELLERGRQQAVRLGAVCIQTEVTGTEYAGTGFCVHTTAGDFSANALILATGASRRTPDLPGIHELEGRGISYCAVCDAFFYRGKTAAVLGAGAYALEEARVLLPVAASVILLTNGADLPPGLPDGLLTDTRPVVRIEGQEQIERVVFQTGEPLPVNGLFVALGTADSSSFAKKLGIAIQDHHIVTGAEQATNIPGIFAAGDCTGGLLQVATAVADGAQAALSAVKYLRSH